MTQIYSAFWGSHTGAKPGVLDVPKYDSESDSRAEDDNDEDDTEDDD
ncbi:hypothetical protein Tco_0687170, partial [Tanacetum coccineum]